MSCPDPGKILALLVISQQPLECRRVIWRSFCSQASLTMGRSSSSRQGGPGVLGSSCLGKADSELGGRRAVSFSQTRGSTGGPGPPESHPGRGLSPWQSKNPWILSPTLLSFNKQQFAPSFKRQWASLGSFRVSSMREEKQLKSRKCVRAPGEQWRAGKLSGARLETLLRTMASALGGCTRCPHTVLASCAKRQTPDNREKNPNSTDP